MNTPSTHKILLALRTPTLIVASAMLLSACGGSSSSGSKIPTFGLKGDNPCYIDNTNQVDLSCYLVPGETGENPKLTYTTYVRDKGDFVLATAENNTRGVKNGESTFSWSKITESTAQYKQLTETTYFSWDDTNITQTDDTDDAEEEKLTRTLTPLIGAENTVTQGSRTGKFMVFEPKERTITAPGTDTEILARNAIMVVQIVDLGIGYGLVTVEHYAPSDGAVALTHYLTCPKVAELDFVDNAEYYEEKCASTSKYLKLDWSWILKSRS